MDAAQFLTYFSLLVALVWGGAVGWLILHG